VHPIERLRYVARAGVAEQAELVPEAGSALGGLGDDPGALVMSCRRLLERHPTVGSLWVLCARMLGGSDPRGEAWRVTEELDEDRTPGHVARLLPDDATVVVVGWPEVAAAGLRRRGDVTVRVVEGQGDGPYLVRKLADADVAALRVPDAGVATAVTDGADLVLLEANALGPEAFVAATGSLAAAVVARHAGVPVWLVAGADRALPARLWDGLLARWGDGEAWDRPEEIVPLSLVDRVIGPAGGAETDVAAGRADCAAAPELLGG
jgi:hypothetical protein